MKDVLSLDATAQLQALAAHRISACELLEASVARTDQLNPELNAVVSRDLDRAYASARLVDDRRARGESLGLLAGLPMTVKDALDVAGLPASAGIESLLHRTATDAVVVSRVRAEGAIVWGKTNTAVKGADWQTYNALYGTTNNPWDLKRTPGGSSGGSAAALAACLTALEIGADMADRCACRRTSAACSPTSRPMESCRNGASSPASLLNSTLRSWDRWRARPEIWGCFYR